VSPEQATGERTVDGRADIYSLGCVLYEMLAGDPPHLGGSMQAVIAKVLTEKPASVRIVRDTVPEHVDWAIDRALAKVPADRWPTARDFADALAGRASATVPRLTTTAGIRPARRGERLMRALPWVLFAAAVATLFA